MTTTQSNRLVRLTAALLLGTSCLALCGCAGSGNRLAARSASPCPVGEMPVEVGRTAQASVFRCVQKDDVHALLKRPTDDGRIH